MVLVTQTASETVGVAGVRMVLARDGNSSTTTVLPAMVVPGVSVCPVNPAKLAGKRMARGTALVIGRQSPMTVTTPLPVTGLMYSQTTLPLVSTSTR